METYNKIQTLFDRKENYGVDVTKLRRPEYGVITKWVLTEKIDGTNTRMRFEKNSDRIEIGGRTDNANMPRHLWLMLSEIANSSLSAAQQIMKEYSLASLTLFGEGYGAKIGSGGRYRSDVGFILFDVLVNDKVWLGETQVTQTANTLLIDRVPVLLFDGTIQNAISICGGDGHKPLTSQIADDETYIAEGVVAKPIVPLYDNRGERVMWKLKARDFK